MDDVLNVLSTSNVSTTHLCDAFPSIRLIRSLNPITQKRFHGAAHTVKAMGDIVPVWMGIESALTGSVLVIDGGDSTDAVMGEFLTRCAISNGVSAVVLFGFSRDTDAIKELGLPFFSMGQSPRAGTKCKLGELGCTLQIDDFTISEGEYVIGDADGIVVLSAAELKKYLPAAIEIMEKENSGLNKMRNEGASINQIFNFSEHYDNLLSNVKSELTLRDE
ncbi:regulator of RNase E activity RraA [Oxalobacteraceae bacterium GrIS 2.11]